MTLKDGLPCKKCGTDEWYVGGGCKVCKKEQALKWKRDNPERKKELDYNWRLNNPEKKRESDRRWAQENPDRIRENCRNWRKANPERKRKNDRDWYNNNLERERKRQQEWKEANPDKVKEYSRNWRENNLDKVRVINRNWERNNPDKVTAKKNRYRTYKTKAGGFYTADEFKALCEQYDNRCACCREKKPLTFDHVIPVSKGGRSDIQNAQPLCRSCNGRKGDKETDYRT